LLWLLTESYSCRLKKVHAHIRLRTNSKTKVIVKCVKALAERGRYTG
jgi:hypothetical protein